MANFLEEFFASTADNMVPDPDSGVGTFLDNVTPDRTTIAGNLVTASTALPTLLLRGGVAGAEGLDNAMSRPFSTFLQAANFDNPLYRDGLQLSDFTTMWNASSYLSPGRMLATGTADAFGFGRMPSDVPVLGDWGKFSYRTGYDPYTMGEQGTEDLWDNSLLGTISSTGGDFFWQLAAGKGIDVAAGAIRRGAGLSTNIKGARDLSHLDTTLTDHIKWAETQGAEGAQSHWGNLMMDIANTNNVSEILKNPFLHSQTRTGSVRQLNLAQTLTRVNDPATVKDLLLADRGDARAIGRLFQNAPDHVWALSDMNSAMRARFAEGGQWHPTPEESATIRQVFDSHLQKDEFYRTVRDMFMQTEGITPTIAVQGADGMTVSSQMGKLSNITRGNDTVPMTGVAGRAQAWLYQAEMASQMGSTGMWIDHHLGRLGSNAPVTTLLQWVGGRKPLNHVSLSGLRPTEIVDEMMAYSASSRALRGAKAVTVNQVVDGRTVPVEMTMDQWRNQALARLGQVSVAQGDTGLYGEIQTLERELVSIISNKYGVAPNESDALIRGLQEARDASQRSVANEGYFWDEVKGRVEVNPATRRQLAADVFLLPLDELDYELRLLSTTAYARRGRTTRRIFHTAGEVVDWVLRFWRSNQLFKPAYTPKNSGLEPGMSSFIAHGTIVSPDGLIPALNNYVINRGRQAKGFGYWVADKTGLSGVRKLNAQLVGLHSERLKVQHLLDEDTRYLDDIAAGRVSPANQTAYLRAAVDSRRSLGQQLSDIESRLDEADPGWRDVQAPPSYGELSSRLNDIESVVKADDAWEADIRTQADTLIGEAESRATSSVQDVDQKIAGLEESLARVRARRTELYQKLETDEVVGDQVIVGGPADMTPPKVAPRSRDYEGMSTARQEESLLQQIEALKERKASLVEQQAGTETALPLFLSPAERQQLARLENLLAMRERYVASGEDWTERVANLRASQSALSDEIAALSPDVLAKKLAHEAELARIDGDIRIRSLRMLKKRARREKARARRLGGEKDWTADLGQYGQITTSGLFNEGSFGAAMRGEVSAGRTNVLTFDPGDWSSAATARWVRAGGVDEVMPSDPAYWEELAYIANRQIRGDQFATLVLQGESLAKIAEWLRKPAGSRYARSMGWTDQDVLSTVVGTRSTRPLPRDPNVRGAQDVRDIRGNTSPAGSGPRVERETGTFDAGTDAGRRRPANIPVVDDGLVATAHRLILQYFPEPAVRARLLEDADVTPADLQALMGESLALSPIHAGELNWAGKARVRRAFNNAFNAIWANLATNPEDRFGRFPFMDAKWREYLVEDARFLAEQGQPIRPQVFNNLRAAAATRALKETEQTFYNIRRYSNPVFAMRYLYGFPGAYFNSLYRYGRFAAKYPGRTYLTAQAYTTVYQTFGLDAEGNKTDNWADAKYLSFPMPPGFNKLTGSEEARFSVGSVDFISQQPSILPQYVMQIDTVLKFKPGADDWIKDHWGEGVYRQIYPFGKPSSQDKITVGPVTLDPLFAGWELDLATAMNPSNDDFIATVDQIHMANLAEWEKDGKVGMPPQPEQAMDQARNYWFGRSFVKFFGLGGTRLTPVGQMMREDWYRTKQKFGTDYEAAKADYIGRNGPEAEWYIQSSSGYRAYMPSSLDAFDRLEKHTDLANTLRSLNPQDPRFVELLFWGSETTFDTNVYNWMSNNALPGDTQPMRFKLTPEQMQDQQAAEDSWDKYNRAVAYKDAMMLKYGFKTLSSEAAQPLADSWNAWLDAFKAAPENAAWLAEYGNANFAKATQTINALHTVLSDESFMRENADVGGYTTAGIYLTQLQTARDKYNAATTTEERDTVSAAWDEYVTNYLLPSSSDFANLYTRNLQGKDLS